MLQRLKKRQEFLDVAASGGKFVTSSVVVQYRKQPETLESPCCRVGFTVTKRQGNSVVRNRIRRRLREAFRRTCENQPMSGWAMSGWDFVMIGRHTAQRCDFDVILQDMRYALTRLAREQSGKPPHA